MTSMQGCMHPDGGGGRVWYEFQSNIFMVHTYNEFPSAKDVLFRVPIGTVVL